MLDDRHVLRAEAGAQARQIIVEDDVEHPVQPVLDAPVAADGACEGLRVQPGRAEVVAGLALGLPAALSALAVAFTPVNIKPLTRQRCALHETELGEQIR